MALTIQSLAERATREARGGFSEAESGINVTRAALLVPRAMQALAENVANDSLRRDLLTTEWEITLTDGEADLTATDYDYLLKSALCYSVAFDGDDPERTTPLVWVKQPHKINWGGTTALGYYTMQGNTLKTRQANSGSLVDMRTLILIANYIPALGSNAPVSNPYIIPPELENEAITTLAMKLREAAKVGF